MQPLIRPKAIAIPLLIAASFLPITPAVLHAAAAGAVHPLLPLSFEQNNGQVDKRAAFVARSPGQTVFFLSDSVLLRPKNSADLLRLTFSGMRTGVPLGLIPRAATVNYFHGSDPAKWQTGVQTFEKVAYRAIKPGVDLVFYGNARQLEYDLVVRPHADLRRLEVAVTSMNGVRAKIGDNGDLVAVTSSGEVRFLRPTAYQVRVDGSRVNVDCHFVLHRDKWVGFALGNYDHAQTLVIDPILTYSTFLGGSDDEGIFGIQRDAEGNIYLAGETSSLDFPTADPLQARKGGDYDAFVSKFDRDGTRLIYSTYLGGTQYDHCVGLAIDSRGDAFVTGVTLSPDFPTHLALQGSLRGQANVFVAGIDQSGSKLIFSTYLGGSQSDSPGNIVLDRESNIYVSGSTQSADFPVTASAYQKVCDKGALSGFCGGDAFVTKMDARGSRLIYSTFLGGGGNDSAADIAVDETGSAYVAGQTSSADFPVLKAYQPVLAGSANAFVTKLDRDGSALIYSTYLGGSQYDGVFGIALDRFKQAYVTGMTSSPNFPTVHPFQRGNMGGYGDGFVSKLSSSGSELIYSSYFGGSGWDLPFRIGVDLFGSASIAGLTTSPDFPIRNAVQAKFAGGFSDAFVLKVNAEGTAPVYSTYLGGAGDDYGYALYSDLLGGIWVGGSTSSPNYPVKRGYQSSYAGGPYDAFLSAISATPFSTLDALEQLRKGLPQAEKLDDLIEKIRLSIGSKPASVTLDALRRVGDTLPIWDQSEPAVLIRLIINELSRQVKVSSQDNE